MTYDKKLSNLDAAVGYIVAHYKRDMSLAEIAVAAEMPQNTMTRHFNKRYGLSPQRWVWGFKAVLAANFILEEPDMPFAEVAERCGFKSLAHFSRKFRQVLGKTPTLFREESVYLGNKVVLPEGVFGRFTIDHVGAIESALVDLLKPIPIIGAENITVPHGETSTNLV
jgi:AraC-like DNA-binding protein